MNIVARHSGAQKLHPHGVRAKILLCSVFGPYGVDDNFGSRRLNPMELYHNQVTRTQGAFSLRMFHRSWGIMMIQANISAPCMVLDFPTLERFEDELRTQEYDVIGISSIIPNTAKVREMCRLIRQYQPKAKIVIGGHIANVPDLDSQVDADYIVKGDGIEWFRRYLGENPQKPLRHPMIISGFGIRNVGVNLRDDVAATIIPSVGCPMGCNFCSTSAMFGGKGHSVNFYKTGDELFCVMRQIADGLKVRSFFMMDENFLLHKDRALRLLELMEQHNKPWSLYVFTSARVLRSYTIDQLLRLGVSWVWMGLEGEDSQYEKLHGIDTFALVNELQANGIHVLGSTIIGLENHTRENISDVIDYAIRHDTDFHQFMLYTPIPGTPLHAELSEKGLMKHRGEYDPADIHGQKILNYRHPQLSDEDTARIMVEAFDRDFTTNGPSTVRIVRTTLTGWLRHKNHPDPRVRDRIAWESRNLPAKFSALVGATERYFRGTPQIREKMSDLRARLAAEFGLKSKFFASVGGLWVRWLIGREERRLANGFLWEPKTFYEGNDAVLRNVRRIRCAEPLL
jgi:radical SAM superfamily enzyme YgiQ (UPF0313 family)